MVRRVVGKASLTVQGVNVDALFDTGATRSFVSLNLAEKLGYLKYDKPKEALLAVKGAKAPIVGEVVARVKVLNYELPLSHVFGVVEGLSRDVIIGMDIMEPYEIIVDPKGGKIAFKRFPPAIEPL